MNWRFWTVAVLVLLAITQESLVLADQRQPMVYVHGRVIDADSGMPVEGVRLRILREMPPQCLVCRNWVVLSHSVTADRGFFGFGVSPIKGTYMIQFFSVGYQVVSIVPPAGLPVQRLSDGWSVEFPLEPKDGDLVGPFIFVVRRF